MNPWDNDPAITKASAAPWEKDAPVKAEGAPATSEWDSDAALPSHDNPLSREAVTRAIGGFDPHQGGGLLGNSPLPNAAAGAASGTLGLSESVFRTPDAIGRWAGGAAESVENATGLPHYLDPIRGIQTITDFISGGKVPGVDRPLFKGTNDVAEGIGEAQNILSDENSALNQMGSDGKPLFSSFVENKQAAEKADRALNDAINKGDYRELKEVATDPKAFAGFVGQAAPSLVAAYVSGGTLPFTSWMEAMQVSSDAADFEKRTGQKISNTDFMKAQAQTGLINGLLEKVVPESLLKGEAGKSALNVVLTGLKEAGTETIQQVNQNASEKYSFDPSKSLTEGVLASGLGGLGGGVGSSGAQYLGTHAIAPAGGDERRKEERPTDTSDPVANAINTANNTLDGAPVSLADLIPKAQPAAAPAVAPVEGGWTTAPGAAPEGAPADSTGAAAGVETAPAVHNYPAPEGTINYEPVKPDLTTALGAAPESTATTDNGIPFVSAPSLTTESRFDADKRVATDARIAAQREQLGEVKLPEGFDDPRLSRLKYRDSLRGLADLYLQESHPKAITPEVDTLLTAIAKAGGLNSEEAKAQGIDPAHFKDLPGKLNPFRKDGKSFDAMAETLNQHGYFGVNADHGAQDLTNALVDKVSDSVSGNPVYSTLADHGAIRAHNALDLAEGSTPAEAQIAIRKALAGEKLGTRQARIVQSALDRVTGARRQEAQSVRLDLEKARTDRRAQRQGFAPLAAYEADDSIAGEIYEESAYPADWDAETRTAYEWAVEAAQHNPRATKSVLQAWKDDQISRKEAVNYLLNIIAEAKHGQEHAGTTESSQRDTGEGGQPHQNGHPTETPRRDTAAAPAAGAGISPEAGHEVGYLPFAEAYHKESVGSLKGLGLSAEDAETAARHKRFAAPVDAVTGMYEGRREAADGSTDTDHAIARAIDHVKRTGKNAFWFSADVKNLGGLNAHMNNVQADANQHYRALADIVQRTLGGLKNTTVDSLRTGGDEFGALLAGSNEREIRAAIKTINDEVERYRNEHGLADFEHPKYPGDASKRGLGLHLGYTQITSDDTPLEVKRRADISMDESKQGISHVRTEQAPESGAVVRDHGPAANSQEGRGAVEPSPGERGKTETSSEDARHQVDLLGDNTQNAQSLTDAQRAKDTQRNGASSDAPAAQGNDLFSGGLEPDLFAEKYPKVNPKVNPSEETTAHPELATKSAEVSSSLAGEQKAASILDAANVTGKERLDIMRDFRDGKHTLADLEAAYPAKDRQKSASTQESEPSRATSYGKTNTVFTEDAAAKARERLRQKLGRTSAGLDPEMVQDGITLAGYHIEAGARSFAAYSKAMIDDLGEAVRPYLRAWYEAVRYYPGYDAAGMSTAHEIETQQEADNAGGSRADLESDRTNADAGDGLGETALSDESAADDGRGSAGVRGSEKTGSGPRRRKRLPEREAVAHGTGRDQSPFADASRSEDSAASGEIGERGSDTGLEGPPAETVPTEAVSEAATGLNELAAKRKAQKAADSQPVKLADKASIDATLPFLNDGQRADVLFAEQRFAKPDGYGVLFTNGTGTGKTATGMGAIKRYARQGKDNILIVVPSDKIATDWVEFGKNLGLEITLLPDTKSAGKGIVVTTYANMGQNRTLADRKWDLVTADESHYLMQSADGKETSALATLRAITLHPRGANDRARMLHRDLYDRMVGLAKKLDGLKAHPDMRDEEYGHIRSEQEQTKKELDAARAEFDKANNAVVDEVRASQGEQRPRVTLLSATPWAYEKAVDYAEGYLFDYPEEGYIGNSRQGGFEKFMVEHFGYRIRYHKLTEPDANVDRGLMQRQFNSWLKQEKVLSGRALDVAHDYDRRFILTESAVGQKIDDGLEWLWKNKRMRPVADLVHEKFDHLTRRYLLEAIKAQEAIPLIRDQLAAGRKVVVFHDFKKGGGFNPFNLQEYIHSDHEVTIGDERVKLGELVREYMRERPDLQRLPLDNIPSPIAALSKAFPDLLLFNGDIPKSQRRANVEAFQSDHSGKNLMLVQSAAGKEGISLHDTTGQHQRVLYNLGLPTQPTTAIQQEGRIYRTGQKSDAMFRYLNTGTNWERWAFADTIARRSSTAENLALGEQARALLDGFIQAFEESDSYPAGHPGEGKGGKARDATANAALSDWDRAMTLYFAQHKRTSRTKALEGADYFATPEPLGKKLVDWGDVRPEDELLEPSAGHGAIARWFPDNNHRTVIEPSPELSSRLKMVTDAKLLQHNFEDYHIVNKHDVIVTNPPFGTGGKTAMEHIAKDAVHLRDGGRIVAIIPQGPAMEKRLDKWLYDTDEKGRPTDPSAANMRLVATVDLPTSTFERAGTKVAARVVVLDKVSDKEQAANLQTRHIDLSGVDTIKELFDRLEHMEMPARVTPRAAEQEAAPETTAPPVEGGYTLGQTKHSKTGADLYVATLNNRVERDEYTRLNGIAKQHGGWYSSFKGNGAIPGFQFKSEEGRQAFLDATSQPAAAFSRQPRFYSGLQRAIEGAPDKMFGKGAQFKLWISANAAKLGIKQDELQWSGLPDYLDLMKGEKVSKQAVLDFLSGNGVQVNETTKYSDTGDELADLARDGLTSSEPKFAKYTPPGGIKGSYRETLITLPSSKDVRREKLDAINRDIDALSDELIDKYGAVDRWPEAERNKLDDLERRHDEIADKDYAKDFKSSHWDEPNVLVHLRTDEVEGADGKRYLRVIEIQSDWGQKGKKEGFINNEVVKIKEALKEYEALVIRNANAPRSMTEADRARIRELQPIVRGQGMVRSGVPLAPFVTDTKAWVSLGIKRAIMQAVNDGVDGVVFATGQQNADLYDLSKQVQSISYMKVGDKYRVTANQLDNGGAVDLGTSTEAELEDKVGKEVAKKIVNGEGVKSGDMTILRGLDLKVGGEGMRAFYDKIVPQVANDVLKKVGGGKVSGVDVSPRPKVEYDNGKATLTYPDGRAEQYDTTAAANQVADAYPHIAEQPGFPITDAMRQQVQTEGLPLFKKGAKQGVSIPAETVQQWLDAITSKLPNAPKVHVIASMDEAPAEVRAEDQRQRYQGAIDSDPEAFYHTRSGDTYIVLSGLKPHPGESEQQALVRAYAHEVLGHAGLRGLFGKQLDSVLGEVAEKRSPDVAAKARQYGLDVNNEQDRLTAAEEVLAEMAQSSPSNGLVTKAVEMVRRALRSLLMKLPASIKEAMGGTSLVKWANSMSDAEIVDRFIVPARQYMERGAGHGSDQGVARFSRSPEGESAPIPKETAFQKQQRIHQDKFNRFNVIESWLKENGAQLSEDASVYHAEERYHGRVTSQTDDFREHTLKPLIKKMQKGGFTLDEVAQFLHAQHAEERNLQIAKINPKKPDGGSGMSTAEARDILANASPELKAVANEYRAISDGTLDMLLRAGIITPETVHAYRATYQHYVPLKGGDEATQGGTGKGFTAKHKSKRALGHDMRDEMILENIQRDRERAIVTIEKNRVGQHLIKLAIEAQRPDLITVGQPVRRGVLKNVNSYAVTYAGSLVGSFESEEAARVFVASESTRPGRNISEFTIEKSTDPMVAYMASPMLAPNETQAYVDGHAVRIQIKDEVLARAYNNMGVEALDTILRLGRSLNTYLSTMYTGLSPSFTFRNLVRDWTAGMINMTGQEGLLFAAKAAKNYPKAAALLTQYAVTGKPDPLIQQYRLSGGTTGAAYLSDLERLGHEARTAYDQYAGLLENARAGHPVRGLALAGEKLFTSLLHPIEQLNMVSENSMRLAAFMTALESGMSRNKAASLAKNVTINFNRKGEKGAQINALWLFHNASMQGSAVILHALFKGEHKHQAQALVAGLVLIGALLAMTNGGGDDDDYEKLQESVKERNLTFRSKDGWITIPLPYGYGWFVSLGRDLANIESGKLDKQTAALHLMAQLVQETTVFGNAIDPDNQDVKDLIYLLPTVAQLPGAIATNNSPFHNPIFPEPFNPETPDSQKLFRNTVGTPYAQVAQWANAETGGNMAVKGWADVSPETLKYIWRTLTGGAGGDLTDAASALNIAAQGATPEVRDVPVVRGFYRADSVQDARARFQKYAKEAEAAKNRFALARKARSGEIAQELIGKEGTSIALAKMADTFNKAIKTKQEAVASVQQDATLPLAEKRAQIKALEDEETALYDSFVTQYKARQAQ